MSITLLLGAPGTGKSTFFSKLAKKNLKKRDVYCNFYIANTKMINLDDLNYNKIENALILWDEGGTDFDNRNFKNFKDRYTRFFKMHRHYNLDIIIASQGMDIDKKIMTLVDRIIVMRPTIFAPYLNCYRKVKKILEIDEETRQFIDCYSWKGLPHYNLAFRYWKYFNSHWQDILNDKEFPVWCVENEKLVVKDYTKKDVLLEENKKK